MRPALFACSIALALTTSLAAPAVAAEFRKVPGQDDAAARRLRSTPDANDATGVNTDPAMTSSTTDGKRSGIATPNGDACRTGGGQSYPNAKTDNPPGMQFCPP